MIDKYYYISVIGCKQVLEMLIAIGFVQNSVNMNLKLYSDDTGNSNDIKFLIDEITVS